MNQPSVLPGDVLYQTGFHVIAPVVVSYINYIFQYAQSHGIRTLYFLARDGYVLHQAAQRLCQAGSSHIECRYLYCSRKSFRTPSYHLIGEEAFDLLTLFSHEMTAKSFFQRADIPDALRGRILSEIGEADIDLHQQLTPERAAELKQKLVRNTAYRTHIETLSRTQYDSTIGYLKQEGLFDQPTAAIVDSGWYGSVQRSLRQLMESAGYNGTVLGFYFGMLDFPKSHDDGVFVPWMFSRDRHYWNTLFFNNNIFECMLSAPHGMTLSYGYESGRYVPELAPYPSDDMLNCVNAQIQGILDGVDDYIAHGSSFLYETKAQNRLRRFMFAPAPAEVLAYNHLLFCDDITEGSHCELADSNKLEWLKEYQIPRRIWRKLRGIRLPNQTDPLWPYGTLALEPSPMRRGWYQFNFLISEVIHKICYK